MNFTIFANTTFKNNIMVGFINSDGTTNTVYLARENVYNYFLIIIETLKDLRVNVDSIDLMFKGEDSLSYQMLDAFVEANQNHQCEYTFDEASKTLMYRMNGLQLTIFNFNYLGYINNITEDFNAFEEESLEIEDIAPNKEDYPLSILLIILTIVIIFNLNFNDYLSLSILPFLTFVKWDKFWDYLSFFTFWLVCLWWIFAWTIMLFNLFYWIFINFISYIPFLNFNEQGSFYIINCNVGLTGMKINKVKTKFMKTIEIHQWTDPQIITFDIETILKDGVHVPYLFSMFDGKNVYSWFTSSPEGLFNQLLKPKYRGYQVYAHNLSGFDIIFIFKYLGSIHKNFNINVIRRDSKIIFITITKAKLNISITIKDSFLLLPSSLAKLSKNFNIDVPKGIEPVLTQDCTNTPGSDFYIMNDVSHYNKEVLKLNNYLEWKELVQKYCEIDCISLHQILIKFRTLIFEEFDLLIDKYPTTPSLAFAIFRTNFLKKDMIPILNDDIDRFIRGSFTGGSTESIIPYGQNVYCYDVNSLYPASMANNLFSIGEINTFSRLDEVPKNNIWFAEVEVNTKVDLHIPYLQIHHNNRTISPNGKFKMIINSCEYFNALNDYDFKIIKGYHFKSGMLFFDYVNKMYMLRLQYTKDQPMNFIAKLLMNSLYGRFGMKNVQTESLFVNESDLRLLNVALVSSMKLDEDLYFIESTVEDSKDFEINVGIASAITAYSRVHMQRIKKYCFDNNINIYYFDTDSLFVDKPLPDYMISSDLGALKLEYIFKEAVFLGPKIYAGILVDGTYICKVKGFKDSKSISFNDMKSLLVEGASLNLSHIRVSPLFLIVKYLI